MKLKLKIALTVLMPAMGYANSYLPIGDVKGFHVIQDNKYMAQNVFTETDRRNDLVKFLFNLNENRVPKAPIIDNDYLFDSQFVDTGLKKNLYEIKLSIPYIESPFLKEKAFGYAPIGGYENGWDGIKTFFSDPDLGVCSYSFEKFTYIQADSSYVGNFISGYPSFKSIEGNKDIGYLYSVSWDIDRKDYVYDHKLQCANKVYSQDIMNKLIMFAKSIAI